MTIPLPPLSSDAQARLETYHSLLLKWQKRINLIAPATVDAAWDRHFADSIQLLPDLGDSIKTIVDLGSGAGFPGLALALARPDIHVHLIESDEKKCEFMRTVSRETHCPVTVHTSRIEALPPFPADMITARALAPLPLLLSYALPFVQMNPSCRLVFLKGETWAEEVAVSRETYDFTLQDRGSITHPKARVLIIQDLFSRG